MDLDYFNAQAGFKSFKASLFILLKLFKFYIDYRKKQRRHIDPRGISIIYIYISLSLSLSLSSYWGPYLSLSLSPLSPPLYSFPLLPPSPFITLHVSPFREPLTPGNLTFWGLSRYRCEAAVRGPGLGFRWSECLGVRTV